MRSLSRITPMLLASLVFLDLGFGAACTHPNLDIEIVKANGTLSYSEEGSVRFSAQSLDPFLLRAQDTTYTIDASYSGTSCEETVALTFDRPTSPGAYDLSALHAQLCIMDLESLRASDFCNGTRPSSGTTEQQTCIPIEGSVTFTEVSQNCAGQTCMTTMVADLEMTAPSGAMEAVTGSLHLEIGPEAAAGGENDSSNGCGKANWSS
jgi:hypothetical protein